MERGDKIRGGQTDGRHSLRNRIPILSFLLLPLIFSCKSSAQTGTPTVIPQAETQVDQSQEPLKIAEPDTAEEMPFSSDIDEEDNIPETANEEDSEETLEEPLEEEEQPESPESESIDEIPETPEVEETPIQDETQEPEEQELTEEEDVPLPVEEPPPVEQPPVAQPPVIQQPPPAQLPPPPVQQPPPVQPPPPPSQQPPVQSQVPEQTAPRLPPSPPPFLGPAEPEITPPSRQEPVAPAIPDLPSLPRDEKPEEQIVFSRVVRLTVGQMLEIPFRGTGWVYLGEMGNRRGISYDSRRLDTQGGNTLGQSFIFRAEIAGTYILKFYKQDFIQDYIINDYVQVIVGEADDSGRGRPFSGIDRGRVIAEPRWPSISEVAEPTSETVSPATGAAAGTQRSDAVQAVEPASQAVSGSAPATAAPSQTSASPPDEVMLPNEYVRQAKQEFDAGHVEQALDILERMKQRYPSGTDEAWWLLGQLYEANSPARDIRQSLEYYRRLVNEYPQSNRVDDARRRIAYLERYYLNIR
jgi:chemotaxis protein histidine kinase CheA